MSGTTPMLFAYDRRDAAVFSQCPMLMMPRFGELPDLGVGQYRFIAAQSGIYLQARTHALDVCVPFSVPDHPANLLPYGELEPHVHFTGGLLPASLRDELFDLAIASCPNECGAYIGLTAKGGYSLYRPAVLDRSPGHIRMQSFDDHESLFMDVHSHGHGAAYFSATDDRSDQDGIYVATVLGHCESRETITAVSRIVVYGRYTELEWNPWEE